MFWWLILFFVQTSAGNLILLLAGWCGWGALIGVGFWMDIGEITAFKKSPTFEGFGKFISVAFGFDTVDGQSDCSTLFGPGLKKVDRYKAAVKLLVKKNLDPFSVGTPVLDESKTRKRTSAIQDWQAYVAAVRKYWLLRFTLAYVRICSWPTVLVIIAAIYFSTVTYLAQLSGLGVLLLGSVMLKWRVPDEHIAATQ
jgi:hypothetical protein